MMIINFYHTEIILYSTIIDLYHTGMVGNYYNKILLCDANVACNHLECNQVDELLKHTSNAMKSNETVNSY